MGVQINRFANFILSAIILLIFLPILLALSAAIFFETGENPIFIQERGVTLENNRIKILKLRTLKRKVISLSAAENILVKEDLRHHVTFFGRILRKTGIDELPQLVNVLKGEMSLIGPRPLSIPDLHLIKNRKPDVYERRRRLKSKPGISGFWQIFGDKLKGAENLVLLDELYEERKSFYVDLILILSTVIVLTLGKHNDSILINSGPEKLSRGNGYPIVKNLFPKIETD